jgi:hypothetical protein
MWPSWERIFQRSVDNCYCIHSSAETTAFEATYASRNVLLRLGQLGQYTWRVEVLAARTAWLYIELFTSKHFAKNF